MIRQSERYKKSQASHGSFFGNFGDMWRKARLDKVFFFIVVALVSTGLLIFTSAALSILAEDPKQFYRLLLSQYVFGLIGGLVTGYLAYRIPYTFWKRHGIALFALSIISTALVFIPGLGVSNGGARRWISFGGISVQPAEFLKVGFIIFASAWYARVYRKVSNVRYGIIPLLGMLTLVGGVLLAQPDTGTFLVIAGTGVIMYFVSGARIKDLIILILMGLVGSSLLIATRPYLLSRINTFLNPANDPQGSSYQVRQAHIALGSGGLWGRGYGQSVQKFNYLPEPIGDSVYAVLGEEVGFLGTMSVLLLFLGFALRGLHIARRAPNMYARLLVIGCVVMIVVQSFLNIASILGVFPLTGLPLMFISHGGTSLMVGLICVGLILNVSQYKKRLRSDERT